jgi:hypothetical protein
VCVSELEFRVQLNCTLPKEETFGKKGDIKNITLFQKFRQLVYQTLPKRADAMMALIDALTVAGHVDSVFQE